MFDMVPITLFLVVGGVICAYLYLRYRARQDMQQTLRHALERGQELTPEMVVAMSGDPAGPQGDLRKGVLWLALAGALGLMSWMMDESELLGPAAIPLMLGLAYMTLWAISRRSE